MVKRRDSQGENPLIGLSEEDETLEHGGTSQFDPRQASFVSGQDTAILPQSTDGKRKIKLGLETAHGDVRNTSGTRTFASLA